MDASIKVKPRQSALDYIEAIRDETPGDGAKKLDAWRTEDAAVCSKQARITAVRILIGMAMVEEYGDPPHGQGHQKAEEVAAKYGLKFRRAHDYMQAARAFIRATGLHISDGDDTSTMNLTVEVFDREVQDVRAYIRSWTAYGGNGAEHDARLDRIARAKIVRPSSPEPKDKPTPRAPSQKAWDKLGERFLVNLPDLEGAALYDRLVEHRKLTDQKIGELVVHPTHGAKEGILAELEVLLLRVSTLPDEERWLTVREMSDRAWKKRQEEAKWHDLIEAEEQRIKNRVRIEEHIAAGETRIMLSEVKGLHPVMDWVIGRVLLELYEMNDYLHLYRTCSPRPQVGCSRPGETPGSPWSS